MTNELLITEGAEQLTLTSIEVAEMVGRQHSEVLKDLRRISGQLAEGNLPLGCYFKESSYLDSNNQSRNCYDLTKKGCELYATRMTGTKGTLFAVTYIERFNEMENELKNRQLPSYMIDDPIKRAEKWIVEQKEKQQLQLTIEEQKPLVTFAETCTSSEDSILIRELAKLITEQGMVKIGERKLYEKLREWGLILKGKTEPSQRGMNMDLFEVIQRPITKGGVEKLTFTTKVLPKGQVYIIDRLKNEGSNKVIAI